MESPGRVLSLQSIADHIGGSGVCDVTKEYIASVVERKEASEQVVLHQASTYSDLLARAEMSSLFNKRLQEIAIFIFKIKKNFFSTNILELFPGLQVDYSWECSLRNLDLYFPKM